MEAELDAEVARVAKRLLERADDMAHSVMENVRKDLPAWVLDPALFEMSRQFARESIEAELECLRGAALPEVCPPIDAMGARRGARLGLPLHAILSGYRLGHLAQWDAFFALVEAEFEDDSLRRELLQRGSRFFFDYADRLSRFVTQEFTEERDSMMRSREQRRLTLVRSLLDGDDVDGAELDYDPGGHHVGMAAVGPALEGALRELAHACDRVLLVLMVEDDLAWAWLGGREPPAPEWKAAAQRLATERGLRLCFGDPGWGPEGFRRSHTQAMRAQGVAAFDRPGEVVHYEEIALEALTATDEHEARAFVERELGSLAEQGPRAGRLRETLAAYFAAGQNAAAAAATLGVHEQTVAARLRAVEEQTGRRVAERRAELETALRLRQYLR